MANLNDSRAQRLENNQQTIGVLNQESSDTDTIGWGNPNSKFATRIRKNKSKHYKFHFKSTVGNRSIRTKVLIIICIYYTLYLNSLNSNVHEAVYYPIQIKTKNRVHLRVIAGDVRVCLFGAYIRFSINHWPAEFFRAIAP